MPILRKFHMVFCALLAGGLASHAQDKPDAPQPKPILEATQEQSSREPQQQPAQRDDSDASRSQQQDENTKRILGIIPNFQSKDDIPENQKPMTTREKYVLAYHQTVDFSAHFGNAFQAALQQASNGQPHYGQGWGAYGQRFGAAEADQVTSAFFIFGFLPHVLHDDPRFFRKRRGGVWFRLSYAASRVVITRSDAGNNTFNAPEVVGFLLQQGISTAYYPEQDRTAGRVFQNWGINLGYGGAYNILKEFYPDFLRVVFHRHPRPEDQGH
jgi:hypothetical protein